MICKIFAAYEIVGEMKIIEIIKSKRAHRIQRSPSLSIDHSKGRNNLNSTFWFYQCPDAAVFNVIRMVSHDTFIVRCDSR